MPRRSSSPTGESTGAIERYYGYTFEVSSFWARVRIPFDHLLGEEGSLEEIGEYTEQMMLSLYFDLPAQRVERAVSRNGGLLEFELALDDFLLEEQAARIAACCENPGISLTAQ